MPLSCSGCTVAVPALSASCGINKKPGGIPFLAFVACDDATIQAQPTDLTVWQAAVTANDARVIKGLLGSLPEPSINEVRMQSCNAEQLTGKTWTLNIMDYDFTETGTTPIVFEKEAFYNSIQNNPNVYNLYYGSCDGRMWRVDNFTLVMNPVTPDNNQESKHMAVTIKFTGLTQGTQFVFDLGTV
jgi:hypothetical protein